MKAVHTLILIALIVATFLPVFTAVHGDYQVNLWIWLAQHINVAPEG